MLYLINAPILSQSLVNEGRFPLSLKKKLCNTLKYCGSQSLVNEGRFPLGKGLLSNWYEYASQSLVNEGRFPQKKF